MKVMNEFFQIVLKNNNQIKSYESNGISCIFYLIFKCLMNFKIHLLKLIFLISTCALRKKINLSNRSIKFIKESCKLFRFVLHKINHLSND